MVDYVKAAGDKLYHFLELHEREIDTSLVSDALYCLSRHKLDPILGEAKDKDKR